MANNSSPRIVLLLLLLALLSTSVFSIGVSPAKKILHFEPGLQQTLELKIVNNEGRRFEALLHARGELEEYITFEERIVVLQPDDKSKTIRYTIDLPSDIGKPGIHDTDIVITEFELNDPRQGRDTIINAKQSVYSKLEITVPTPGKYAEASLNIDSANVGESVLFTIPIFNFGTEHISQATALIEIERLDGTIVETIATNEVSLDSKSQGLLKASWTADVAPGVYYARAIIKYDDKQLILENSFDVGNLDVSITKIEVAPFSLGQIAKFDIYLQNVWNQLVQDIYGVVKVFSQSGRELSSFKTASLDLDPNEEGVITAFWDTAGVSVGTYDLKLELNYAGRIKEETIQATVAIDSIVTGYGGTAQVIRSQQGDGLAALPLLTLLVIVLVLINIAWFVYFWRSHK